MTDFAAYQKLEFAFSQLLADLSKTWPTADIAYVRDLVAHAEYGEALENLVTIGVNHGATYDRGLERVQLDWKSSNTRQPALALCLSEHFYQPLRARLAPNDSSQADNALMARLQSIGAGMEMDAADILNSARSHQKLSAA